MKTRWSALALKAYQTTGEEMKAAGYRAMRELKDPACGTVLTLWSGPFVDGKAQDSLRVVIQQTWTDTGDVVLYRSVDLAEAIA